MGGVKRKLEAQTGPMMLLMLALEGLLGTCLLLKISVLVGSGLYDKHETGLACIAQAKLYKMSMLHGCWVCVVHISSTFVAPELVQFVKCGC